MLEMIEKLTMSFPQLLRHNKSYRNAFLILCAIALGGLGGAAAIGEIFPKGQALHAFLIQWAAGRGIPEEFVGIFWIFLKGFIVINIIAISPLFLIWWERKVAAHIQSRYGPMRVGGWHGWLQTLADALKLLLKEDVIPKMADAKIHRMAPAVAFIPAFLAFAPLPFGQDLAAVDLDIGILYVLAVSGLSVFGLMMAGWASGNKFSLLGGLRAAAQLVSYELPRAMSVIPVVMFAESMSLAKISQAQAGMVYGFLPRWFVFMPVVGQISFLIFLISSIAETNRTPFDLPEAESELVAGFHTEYSGMKFSLFFLGEYAYVLLASALCAVLFLGGANPWPGLERIPSWMWIILKTYFVVFIFLWVRWTFPRFRIDRVLDFNWKFLLPWSFVNIGLMGLILLFK